MTMVGAEFFAPEMRDVLVRMRHVYKVYRIGGTGVVALAGADLDVGRGQFLAVVGPSGAGKSTILNLLGGIDRASAGSVEVDGRDLGLLDDEELTRYRAQRVGFVWQGTARNLVPYLSVLENVRLPGVLRGGAGGSRTADELLELVGLHERRRHRVEQLSGGEQQRAAIAVALANTPALLLADEPTAELDSGSAERVLESFRAVNREFAVTIVMVTHDLAAARRADRRIRVRDGRILREGLPVDAVGEDGRVRLPDEAVAAIGGVDLEAEIASDEVRLRKRSEKGHA